MNNRIRITALLGAILVLLCTVFSGCGKRVTQGDIKTTTDGKIKIGVGGEEIPEDSEIVVGEDGQSYLVDGEGNSVVYDATSAYYFASNGGKNTTTKYTTTTTKSTDSTTKTTATRTTTTTTQTTTSAALWVQSVLIYQRQSSGSSSAGLKIKPSAMKYSLTSDREDETWTVEFHKGQYADKTFGCEVGIYKNGMVANSETVTSSAKLYDFDTGKEVTSIPTVKGWKMSLVENTNVSNPVMIATVNFDVYHELQASFVEKLKANEFTEGSVESYRDQMTYCVSGSTVTFVW